MPANASNASIEARSTRNKAVPLGECARLCTELFYFTLLILPYIWPGRIIKILALREK